MKKKRKQKLKKKQTQMLSITAFTDIGKRPYQEDRYTVISKFGGRSHLSLTMATDGHGGSETSTFLSTEYPKQLLEVFKEQRAAEQRLKFVQMMGIALERCIEVWDRKCFGSFYGKITNDKTKKQFFDQRDEKHWKDNGLEAGSTLVAMLIDMRRRRAHVINIGDSRATWIIGDEKMCATVDHGVKKKMSPIKGFAFANSDGRLQGDLAMSHSVGDNTQELYGVVSRKYDTDMVQFGEKSFRAVIASDGLFDIASNHNVLYEPFANAEAIAKEVLVRRQEEVNNICLEAGMPVDDIPKITAYDDNVTILYVKIPSVENGNENASEEDAFEDENVAADKDLAKPFDKTQEELQDKLLQAKDLLTKFSSLMKDMTAVAEPPAYAKAKKQIVVENTPAKPTRKKSLDRAARKEPAQPPQRKKSVRRDAKTTGHAKDDSNVTIKFVRKPSRERKG